MQTVGKITLGRGNAKILQGVEIPAAPGSYLVDLVLESGDEDAPPVEC